MRSATELDDPTFADTIRNASRRGGADAIGLVYEHYKPMLADHVALKALVRYANLVATCQTGEMLQETMACTRVVAATSGAKGEVWTTADGDNTATIGGSDAGGSRQTTCGKQWDRRSSRSRFQWESR